MKRNTCMLIMPALFVGGAEKQYRSIISELANGKRKIIVLLLNLPMKGEEEATRKFIAEHPNIEFYQLDGNVLNCNKKNRAFIYLSKVCALLKQRRWIKDYLKQNKINIVMFSYVTQLVLTPLFIRNNVKVVFNERNTGRQICDKRFKIDLLRKCYKVIANSKYAAEYIKMKTGLNVEVFNNGIDEKHIVHFEHDHFVITVPARITRIKNQMLVLEAINEMPNKHNIIVKFAGSIEDEKYERELKTYVENHGLEKNVEFLGYVNDMSTVYGQTDVLLLPSLEEGTPNVLLESYMYRILPLASNIPMNKDCCICDQLLFDPNNPEMLAEKIELAVKGKIVDDTDALLDINESYVHSEYSMKNMKQKYSQLLAVD